MEFITLSNGVKLPIPSFGMYQLDEQEAERCMLDAIQEGYHSINTAQPYCNEEDTRSAVKKYVGTLDEDATSPMLYE